MKAHQTLGALGDGLPSGGRLHFTLRDIGDRASGFGQQLSAGCDLRLRSNRFDRPQQAVQHGAVIRATLADLIESKMDEVCEIDLPGDHPQPSLIVAIR